MKDRATINRENAQHSTGPRTEEGKQRSALNGTRHGLTSQVIVMPSEDLAAYNALVKSYYDDYKPRGIGEVELVQMLADTAWRLRRIPSLETNLLSLAAFEEEDGINTEHPQIRTALAQAAAWRANDRAFMNLGIQEQRLTRKFLQAQKALEGLQANRIHKETRQMYDAAQLLELHEATARLAEIPNPEPYKPAVDGFGFSLADLKTYVARKERRDLARSSASS
jgi:hypothetical protein